MWTVGSSEGLRTVTDAVRDAERTSVASELGIVRDLEVLAEHGVLSERGN